MRPHNDNELIFGTFNVHYWTDVYENDKLSEIIEDIEQLNADVLVLQEVILGDITINDQLIEGSTVIEELKKIGYQKQILCNTVPSWWNVPYGNLMLIHDRVSDVFCGGKYVCPGFNEENYTFPKSRTSCKVSGKHDGTTETRCYIKVEIPFGNRNLSIYGTHLDVANEDLRRDQIDLIIKNADECARNGKSVIIMGDFNTIDSNQYKNDHTIMENFRNIGQNIFLVIKHLQDHDYQDVFDLGKVHPPEMTSWNNTRVDFIFTKNVNRSEFVDAGIYMTSNSDHVPVFLTLRSLNDRLQDDETFVNTGNNSTTTTTTTTNTGNNSTTNILNQQIYPDMTKY